MNFFYEFSLGVRYYFKAISFVREHRLWLLFAIPALLNLLAFIFVIYISWMYSGDLINYFIDKWGIESESSWLEWLQFLIAFFVRLIVILLYLKLFRYIILIFFAPMLAFISDKVQEIVTKEPRPFNIAQFTRDIYRGMTIAFRNLFFEMVITLAILGISVVLPIIAVVAPFLIFAVESYYYGFAMIDYRNEYKTINAKDSRKLINKHKGLAYGNGAMFNLILFIPFLGVMFAPVIAVIAAGLAINEIDDNG
ncbi:MAG: EI24 domain-containing protein [Cyclobacteriaceae bacterium]|nr:EI24 domain-containing protein [Cyclobacteriaceae bacterium]